MLRPSDFCGFDLAKLEADLTDASLRQDQCLRRAQRAGIPEDFRGVARAVSHIDADAAAVAEASRLVAAVRQFLADESSGRPSAAVVSLRVVPSAPPRPGIFARTMTALGRSASEPAPTNSLPASGKARAQ